MNSRRPNLQIAPHELRVGLVFGVEVHRDGVLLDESSDRRIAIADRGQLATAPSGGRIELEHDQLALALGAVGCLLQRLLPPKQRLGERLGLDHGCSSRMLFGEAYPDGPSASLIMSA